jgi:thiamine-phosphate pyrophosphorylase
MKRKIGRLCVITDTTVQKKYSHIEIARMAIRGSADVIQFRDKYMSTNELIETAKKIRKMCLKAGVLFIVNDRVDVAILSDADGVHLGIEDIPVKEARKLLGKNKIVGGTAHNLKEAIDAEKSGADYIGFGHIYPTGSKLKLTAPVGIEGLKKAVKKIKIPIFAIGGIGLNNVNEVAGTGVHGIAVIGSVVKSSNPTKSVRELKGALYGKKN